MHEQTKPTIKKNVLLDWIYKQKNNILLDDIVKFIESQSTDSKNIKTDKKTKSITSDQLQ